ncbi:MAG: hypothetical protein ABEJ04_02520 [Halobacteriaceae archaeon]
MTGRGVDGDYVAEFFGACHGSDLMEWFPEVGATWWRNGTNWGSVEPERGERDHSRLDGIAERADENDVKLLPILGFVAPWASEAPEGAEHPNRYPPREETVPEWRDYVEETVERYPQVECFEVWNEPNIDHFLKADYRAYVDRILKPAAEVLHDHGKKVVAPSFTLEWPTHHEGHPDRPSSWSVSADVRSVDAWLEYGDAWRHVDYLSVHYLKGDTDKTEFAFADNLLPFYDHVYHNYVEPGKLDGIWNTEEGLTAVEAGEGGDFVAMEPWERPPYAQWVARYTVPVLHWAVEHDWDEPHDYKVFWYHMAHDTGDVLKGTDLLKREDGEVVLSDVGRALRTLTGELTGHDRVATHPGEVAAGFGVTGDARAYEFKSYGFDLDGDAWVAFWPDLPGITLAEPEDVPIQARVEGLDAVSDVAVVDYLTGEGTDPLGYEFDDGRLDVDVPRTDDPVVYLRVEQ